LIVSIGESSWFGSYARSNPPCASRTFISNLSVLILVGYRFFGLRMRLKPLKSMLPRVAWEEGARNMRTAWRRRFRVSGGSHG
jgi:hypothetical protein